MKIQEQDEQAYWDSLSDEYHRITRISTRDFHYGPQIPGDKRLKLLPPLKPGMQALELGCGAAQNSIWLAKQGLSCTAIDVSENQLTHAATLMEKEKVSIRLLKCSLERFHLLLKGKSYDLIHSSHAMEFVERPKLIIRQMAELLKPNGTLMISTVHPLYNGEWVTGMVEDDEGRIYDGQFLTDYFSPPDDVRDDHEGLAISRAYPVSSWFSWFVAAGLTVTAIAEPPAVKQAPYTSDDWAAHGGQLDHIPSTLILLGKKTTAD